MNTARNIFTAAGAAGLAAFIFGFMLTGSEADVEPDDKTAWIGPAVAGSGFALFAVSCGVLHLLDRIDAHRSNSERP